MSAVKLSAHENKTFMANKSDSLLERRQIYWLFLFKNTWREDQGKTIAHQTAITILKGWGWGGRRKTKNKKKNPIRLFFKIVQPFCCLHFKSGSVYGSAAEALLCLFSNKPQGVKSVFIQIIVQSDTKKPEWTSQNLW